jgi:threonine dehydrogenase-like Zn-dependent dehydrogenase
MGARNATADDFREVIRMLEAGKFPAGDAISATVSMDETADWLRRWDQQPNVITKILVKVN